MLGLSFRVSLSLGISWNTNFNPDLNRLPLFRHKSLSNVTYTGILVAESDNLYSRILREMYAPAWARSARRQSNAALAKKLGVDEETVRNAVERMLKTGFLKSWSVSLNPHILGMECESVVVGIGGESKQKIITQLKDVDGVVAIVSFMKDPLLRIVLYYGEDKDLERKIRLVSSICGTEQPKMSWKILSHHTI